MSAAVGRGNTPGTRRWATVARASLSAATPTLLWGGAAAGLQPRRIAVVGPRGGDYAQWCFSAHPPALTHVLPVLWLAIYDATPSSLSLALGDSEKPFDARSAWCLVCRAAPFTLRAWATAALLCTWRRRTRRRGAGRGRGLGGGGALVEAALSALRVRCTPFAALSSVPLCGDDDACSSVVGSRGVGGGASVGSRPLAAPSRLAACPGLYRKRCDGTG